MPLAYVFSYISTAVVSYKVIKTVIGFILLIFVLSSVVFKKILFLYALAYVFSYINTAVVSYNN